MADDAADLALAGVTNTWDDVSSFIDLDLFDEDLDVTSLDLGLEMADFQEFSEYLPFVQFQENGIIIDMSDFGFDFKMEMIDNGDGTQSSKIKSPFLQQSISMKENQEKGETTIKMNQNIKPLDQKVNMNMVMAEKTAIRKGAEQPDGSFQKIDIGLKNQMDMEMKVEQEGVKHSIESSQLMSSTFSGMPLKMIQKTGWSFNDKGIKGGQTIKMANTYAFDNEEDESDPGYWIGSRYKWSQVNQHWGFGDKDCEI